MEVSKKDGWKRAGSEMLRDRGRGELAVGVGVVEKEQLINSSTIRDKLVHNRNHFINCDKRKKWQDLVDWIMLK